MITTFCIAWTIFCFTYFALGILYGIYYVVSHLAYYFAGGFRYDLMFQTVLILMFTWPFTLISQIKGD